MASNKVPSVSDAYKIEKSFLQFMGICPLQNATKFEKLKWFCMCFINSLFLYGHGVALIYDIYLNFNNLDIVLQTMYYATTHYSLILKWLNFVLKFENFKEIDKILNSKMFNDDKPEQYAFLKYSYKTFRLFTKVYRFSSFIVILSYGLMHFVTDIPLPIPGAYPIDMVKYQEPLYVLEMAIVASHASCNTAMDIIALCLMRIVADKFDLLKEDLSKFHCENKEESAIVIRKKVELHNTIYRFADLVEELLYLGVLAQFMLSVAVMCLTLFQLVVLPVGGETIIMALYLLCMMIQVSLYCWFGNQAYEKSLEITETCYTSNWYESPISIQKSIFLIMERAKRPTKLTAGKVVLLNLVTLVAIMRSSFSYFAVLRSLYEE